MYIVQEGASSMQAITIRKGLNAGMKKEATSLLGISRKEQQANINEKVAADNDKEQQAARQA
jgi:hypothetical protein